MLHQHHGQCLPTIKKTVFQQLREAFYWGRYCKHHINGYAKSYHDDNQVQSSTKKNEQMRPTRNQACSQGIQLDQELCGPAARHQRIFYNQRSRKRVLYLPGTWKEVTKEKTITCKTRVKQSFSRAVGSPKCTVRVMSVVPSMYWAPLSSKKSL